MSAVLPTETVTLAWVRMLRAEDMTKWPHAMYICVSEISFPGDGNAPKLFFICNLLYYIWPARQNCCPHRLFGAHFVTPGGHRLNATGHNGHSRPHWSPGISCGVHRCCGNGGAILAASTAPGLRQLASKLMGRDFLLAWLGP